MMYKNEYSPNTLTKYSDGDLLSAFSVLEPV